MGYAQSIQNLPRHEVHELPGRRRRSRTVEAGARRQRQAPASTRVIRCSRWLRVTGVSRGTTTVVRRSFKLTSAARWSRSFDSPIAIPAHAAVLAGTTTIPFARYEPLLGPAPKSPAAQ